MGSSIKILNFKHGLKADIFLFHKPHVIPHLKALECSNVSIYHHEPQNLISLFLNPKTRKTLDKNTKLTIFGCRKRAVVMEKKILTLSDLNSFLKETWWPPAPMGTHPWLQPSL